MITCAVCGSTNEAEAIFCGVCGNRLEGGGGSAGEQPAPAATPATDDVVVPQHKAADKVAASAAPASSDDGIAGDPATPGTAAIAAASAAPTSAAAAPAPDVDDGRVACPVCGTRNDPKRTFCRTCASPLRPGAPVNPNAGWTRKALVSFALSAIVGVSVVLVGAALLQPRVATASAPVSLTTRDGDHLDFGLTPNAPKPLPALPATSTIQLTSFKQAQASSAPGSRVQPPWWNDSVPRIPAVTQFDGGPLEKVNCVMAAGAMLARLGYGIVTTGSQLRALQDDQDGATSYQDLQAAVSRGWGVKFFRGDLTALQFRALLWAGAGVEIGIVYGSLPVPDRLQESFTGNHSIYVDAFRPAGADGPAAYYVMDPIGHTWAGYKGSWLPAEDLERAAKAHSAGMISATWAFAGGGVPKDHRVLPPDAYPSDEPNPSHGPGGTGGPLASGGPVVDPMPTGDLPQPSDPDTGTPPPDTPKWPHTEFVTDAFLVDPGPGLPYCSVLPTPAGCPQGILGIIGLEGTKIATATSPPSDQLKLLYADAIAPGTYQIIFESPPDGQSDLFFWTSLDATKLEQATVDSGYIGGQAVSIATVSVDPTASYSFVASSTGDGVRTLSSVGSLTVSQ